MRLLFSFILVILISFLQPRLDAAFVNAAIGDVFMQRKDCKSAEEQYTKELKNAYNPYVASNLAVAKICLNQLAEAEAILKKAYMQRQSGNGKEQQTVILNYALVLNMNKKYSESALVLKLVDIDSLTEEDKKSTFYTVGCENNFNFDKLDEAKDLCEKTLAIKKDCYNSLVAGKIFSSLKLFSEAEKTLEYLYSNCKDEDAAYYYSFALFGSGNKGKAIEVLEAYKEKSTRNSDLYRLIKGAVKDERK